MAQASETHAGEPADDELTPELALIDPELAARARERLGNGDVPQRPAAEPVVEAAPVVEQIPRAEASVRPVPEPFRWRPDQSELDEEPPRSRGRRFGRALVVVVAVLGAIAVALVAPSLLLEDNVATSNETPAAVPSAPDAAATDDASGPEAPAAGGSRSFGWVPVAGARHYHVAFYRGKEKIYETWPRGPRLVLQPQWTFEGRRFRLSPGQYRWVVRPGFGARRTGRYGPAVVDASLLVRR
jgi:hypothetical protein